MRLIQKAIIESLHFGHPVQCGDVVDKAMQCLPMTPEYEVWDELQAMAYFGYVSIDREGDVIRMV